MEKIIILICAFASLSPYNQMHQNQKLKKEAEHAFYQVFDAYRTNNCDSLVSWLHDSIIFINAYKDTVLKTSDVLNRGKYCTGIFSRKNEKLDKATHQKFYKVTVFTTQEFSKLKDNNAMQDSSLIGLSPSTHMALEFLAFKSHLFDQNDVFVTGIDPRAKEDFYTESEHGWTKNKNLEYEIGWFKLYLFVLRKTNHGWKIRALPT